jgi:hypothetical protein
MHVHSAMSRGRLMQQACGSVILASPLIFFHRGSYNNNSPGTCCILWLSLLVRSVAMALIHWHSSSVMGYFISLVVRAQPPTSSHSEYNCFK